MLKRTKLSIVSTLIYFIFVAGGGALALYMYLLVNGGDAGIGAIGLAVIMVIGIIYAAVGALPLILKFIDIFANKKILSGLCLPFDVSFIIANAALTLSAISDFSNNNAASVIFGAVLLLVSIIEIVLTVSSLKCSYYE